MTTQWPCNSDNKTLLLILLSRNDKIKFITKWQAPTIPVSRKNDQSPEGSDFSIKKNLAINLLWNCYHHGFDWCNYWMELVCWSLLQALPCIVHSFHLQYLLEILRIMKIGQENVTTTLWISWKTKPDDWHRKLFQHMFPTILRGAATLSGGWSGMICD